MHQRLTRTLAPLLLAALLALPAPAQDAPPGLQAVLANGYRFAYLARGAGRPLLLVHRFGEDYRRWDQLLPALADTARALAYSRRYHAPNPWRRDDPPADLTTEAGDLAAILRALHLEAVVLLADGDAAAIAVRAALREPRLVSGVVLLDPWLDPPPGDSTPPPARRAPATGLPAPPGELRGPLRPLTCEELHRLPVPLRVVAPSGPDATAALTGTLACRAGIAIEPGGAPGRGSAEAERLRDLLARFLATLPHPAPAR